MDYSRLGYLHLSLDPRIRNILNNFPPPTYSNLEGVKEDALLELDFLSFIDQNRHLHYNGDFVSYSIQRYEKYWLPFLAQVSTKPEDDLKFAPPMDIYWVWHVHMLSPTKYIKDCKRITGRVIGHALANPQDLKAKLDWTLAKWQGIYPNVPFSVGLEDMQAHPVDILDSEIEYDIKSAALRQGSFYYQVSLDHFRNPKFLEDALTRYKMFLYLKQAYPDKFLVPCYDNDLIWHTHQVSTLKYAKDTIAILGKILPHDDSVNERSKGSKLNTSSDETSKLWMETFGVPFGRPGCMFRGDPPFTRLGTISEPLLDSTRMAVEMTVHIKNVKLTDQYGSFNLPKEGYLRINVVRKMNQEVNKFAKVDFKTKGEKVQLVSVDKKFTTLHDGKPSIQIKVKKSNFFGSATIGTDFECINLFALLPKPIEEGLPKEDAFEFKISTPLNSTKTLHAEIEFSIFDFKYVERTQLILMTSLESFGKSDNFDNQLDLWGPVNVPKTLSFENMDAHETTTR